MRFHIPFFGEINTGDTRDAQDEKLTRLYNLCDASRRPQEADWYANSMYLRGNQLDDLPADVRRMVGRRIIPEKRKKRVEYVANRVLSLCRQGASYLNNNLGREIAAPATQELEDLLSAEVGTQLLEYFRQLDGAQSERFDDIMWCMVAGRILHKVEWDPDLPGLTPTGWRMGAGDVSTTTLSPLHFYLDPWCTRLKDASFVLETRIQDIQTLRDTFGNDALKGVEPQKERAQDVTYLLDALLGSITSGRADSGTATVPSRDGGVLTRIWWFAPTPKHEKGLIIWQAGNKQVHESELPEGVLPFVEQVWLRLPGNAYPLPFITPLRSPAHYHSVLRSQMIQLANAQLRGDTIRRGEGKVHQTVDPQTGRKDLYVDNSVQSFEMMKYQLDYTAAMNMLEGIWDDEQHIAGLRASMIGENPTNVQTVGQLLLLKEPDTAGLALFKGSFEGGYARRGRLQLLVARNHYKVQRLIRINGAAEDVGPQVTAFLGSDLQGVADVIVRPMPIMSEAQKRQAYQEATNLRLFGPYENIQDKRSKLRALLNSGIPGIEQDVRRLAAPLTMAELEKAAGEADMLQFMMQQEAMKAQIAQTQAITQPQVEQDPREAQLRALMEGTPEGGGGGGEGAPPTSTPQLAAAGVPEVTMNG